MVLRFGSRQGVNVLASQLLLRPAAPSVWVGYSLRQASALLHAACSAALPRRSGDCGTDCGNSQQQAAHGGHWLGPCTAPQPAAVDRSTAWPPRLAHAVGMEGLSPSIPPALLPSLRQPQQPCLGATAWARWGARGMHDSAWGGVRVESHDLRRSELSWDRGEASATQQRPSASTQPNGVAARQAVARIVALVEKDNAAGKGLAPSKQHQWQVIVFDTEGGVTAGMQSPASLGLQPRDVSLFSATTGPSKQRATIVAREGRLLFRSEACQAIISADCAFLFPARREKDTAGLAASIRANIRGQAELPFELRVLECLLAHTAHFFAAKGARLEFLMDSVLTDVLRVLHGNGRSSWLSGGGGIMPHHVDLQRLVPIQRSLTEMKHDVKETREAISMVADDDSALAELCLSERAAAAASDAWEPWSGERHTSGMYAAAALLESYERQIQSIEGHLREADENIDTVREVWHMTLDNTRNRTLQTNLTISIASFALMVATVPASFFGMNLIHGLEDSPLMMWPVAGACVTASTITFAAVWAAWRLWPNRAHQQQVRDMRALRDLLAYHLEDLDDVLDALRARNGPVSLAEFTAMVEKALGNVYSSITAAEIDLLFRAFDSNKDRFLQDSEKIRSQLKMEGHDVGVQQ